MTASIQELVQNYENLWWESETSLPDLGPSYSPQQQATHEKELEHLMKQVNRELSNPPRSQAEIQALQKRLSGSCLQFAVETLGISAQQIELLPGNNFSVAAKDFVRQASSFDPAISGEDVYQAGRNAWTANSLQWLLGAPIQCSLPIFAYSMLYPYTDNYLDDSSISTPTKLAFNQRFRQRLLGESMAPANNHERIIFELIGMIEQHYPRTSYPAVFESLLDIHAGQAKSLHLVRPGAAPGEVDVLGISLEKGGTSVLADGYLVRGTLDPAQRQFCFGYGVFAQLLDDLEDVQLDSAAGRLTVYSQAAGHWALDSLTNRTFHFGNQVLEQLACYELAGPLKDLIRRGASSVLLDTASRAERYYTPAYLQKLEAHSPFRFSFLNKQRKDFARRNGSLVKLIETFASQNLDGDELFLEQFLPQTIGS